jgi:hypothetical protein
MKCLQCRKRRMLFGHTTLAVQTNGLTPQDENRYELTVLVGDLFLSTKENAETGSHSHVHSCAGFGNRSKLWKSHTGTISQSNRHLPCNEWDRS